MISLQTTVIAGLDKSSSARYRLRRRELDFTTKDEKPRRIGRGFIKYMDFFSLSIQIRIIKKSFYLLLKKIVDFSPSNPLR